MAKISQTQTKQKKKQNKTISNSNNNIIFVGCTFLHEHDPVLFLLNLCFFCLNYTTIQRKIIVCFCWFLYLKEVKKPVTFIFSFFFFGFLCYKNDATLSKWGVLNGASREFSGLDHFFSNFSTFFRLNVIPPAKNIIANHIK